MSSQSKRLVILVSVAMVLGISYLVIRLAGSGGDPVGRATTGEGEDRLKAVRELAKDRRPDKIVALHKLVRDSDTQVAAEALTAVGRMRRKEDLPVVKAAIVDKRPPVRAAAVRAIGLIGDKPSGPALMDMLRSDPSEEVKVACADALGRIRHLDAMTLLLDLLDDPSERVRRSAAASIDKIWKFDHGFRADDPPEKRKALVQGMRWHWQSFCQSPALDGLKESIGRQP